jgi:acetyl-CoA acetyltransferase
MSGRSHGTACIVGVGETPYTKRGKTTESEYRLALTAILSAAADAGVSPTDIDGFTSFSDERSGPVTLAGDLGIPELRFASITGMPGGGGACGALAEAVMAVEAGQADVVVVYRSLCQGQFTRINQMAGRAAPPPPPIPAVRQTADEAEAAAAMTIPFGLFGPSAMFALPMRRHMDLFGTTYDHLGEVATSTRAYANRNPRAVMGDLDLTAEQHRTARPVADPYRLFDCCIETDGACALIVTTPERAADARRGAVTVLASAQGATADHIMGSALVNSGGLAAEYPTGGGRSVARRLWARAGVGPADIDVAQLYDNFTGQVLFGLEDFGFCELGTSGPFVAGGALRPDGSLPTNTSGGNLSEAYMQGLNQVIEAFRQLRGESTAQVAGAELSLVTSCPGLPTSAVILART